MMNKKSGKRVLSWLLAAAMLIALMPANALANEDDDYGGIDTYAEQNQNNVEFWCTNSAVEVDGNKSTTLSSLLSNKSQLVFAQETSLQTGTLSDGSNLTGNLWKVMVQQNNNKQTGSKNDNKTNVGTEITTIWGERNSGTHKYEYKYLTKDGKTETLSAKETVVVYYKQVFVKDSSYGIIYGADWGYSSPTEGFPIQVTYQFVLEHNNGTTEQLTSKDYWYNNNQNASIAEIGTLLNPQYKISKITVDNEIRTSDNNEVTLKRDESHVVIFYIKKVETTTVKYHWIGPDDFAKKLNIELPTDSKEYNWGDTAELTEKAAAFTPYLIREGSDDVKYMFSGWYDNPALNGSPVDSITVSDSKDTFYGRWTSPAIEVDLNKGDNDTNRFEKTLDNAEKLSDDDEREFTISITNDDSDEIYTGTATVTKNKHSDVPFVFDDSQKMVFDIYDVEFDDQNNPLPSGTDYTYTVRETSDSSDDIEFDNATYKMKVNLKLDGKDLVATVTFTDEAGEEVNAPITFTNTYAPAYPVYVYGRYMHNSTQLKGDNVTVNNKKVQWNEDSTSEKAKDYYITFGKIARGTKTEATEGATNPKLLFNKDDVKEEGFQLDHVFADTGNANFNGVELTSVNCWGDVHACPGAASYNTEEECLTTDIYAWHMDGDINVYTVEYDVNGSNVTNVPANPEGYFFGDYTTADAPTREGYDFQGWQIKDTNGTVIGTVEAGKSFTLEKDVTLVAQWESNTIDVVFQIEHGTWKDASGANDDFTKADQTLPIKKASLPLTLNATASGVPSVMKPDTGYTGGTWFVKIGKTGSETEIGSNISKYTIPASTTDTVYYIFRYTPIEPKTKIIVIYNIEHGTWGESGPHSVEKDFELGQNGSYTLTDADVPSNMIPALHYGNGDWDTNPIGQTLKDDTTFTYTYKRIEGTYYTAKYEWATKAPATAILPVDSNQYDTDADIKLVEDTYKVGDTIPDDNGTWTFLGWKYTLTSLDKVVLFKGSWKFEKTEVIPEPEEPETVNVTFEIIGGTWRHNATDAKVTTEKKVVPIPLRGEAKEGKLTIAHLPLDMQPDANHIGVGYWDNITQEKILNDKITTATTYTYKFNERGTVAAELSKLIQKEFKAQYNYSTEGTFTATAEVTAEPVAIANAAEETSEVVPEKGRIYNGTVTLKTGETAPFTFSVKDRMADVLTPNTHYTVKVSEDAGSLSKVTYDTTKYILTFDTNQDAVVGNILIWKDGEDGKAENTTITFHNIYTYKRHHSSDDGDNGGKKEEKPTVEITDDEALGLNNTDHFAYIVGYGNGEVRPQNSITRAEVAAIFFRLLEDDVRDANYTRQNKFTDVSNDAWYCSAVSTLSAMGIISGYPDATFRPNASITRAEFAAIATRFDVNGDKTPVSFSDIAGHWAKDEIAVAANNGWVNGYEDGSFRPQNKITRAETMSLVNRVLNRRPETAEDLLESMTKWTDNADTNAWYYLAVQEATNSHYYEYKENSQYEKWTELRETRDWSELDK